MQSFLVLKSLKSENNEDINFLLSQEENLKDAHNYIRNLEYLNINNKMMYINSTSNFVPTNKDIDGIFLVNTSDERSSFTTKYLIYLKKTTELKGYIYNTVDISIEKIGYIEILSIENKVKPTVTISTNTAPDFSTNSNLNLNNVNTNPTTTTTTTTIRNRKKSIKKSNNRLNLELIRELKEKLKCIKDKKNK